MAGFKQCGVSDGHLADVLILPAQEALRPAALHKSTQSAAYFGGKAPATFRFQILPHRERDRTALCGNQSRFSGRPPQSPRMEGTVKKEKKHLLFYHCADVGVSH